MWVPRTKICFGNYYYMLMRTGEENRHAFSLQEVVSPVRREINSSTIVELRDTERILLAIQRKSIWQARLPAATLTESFSRPLTIQTMSRLTWMQQSFEESYSKDPSLAAVLLDSLTHRNISDFRYALEVMKCDPNLFDASSGLSVFQTVLQTPKSSDYIKLCITSGANFYKVRTRR